MTELFEREREFLLPKPSLFVLSDEDERMSISLQDRVAVSRRSFASPRKEISFIPRVAPEILTTSLERFHNWANTKKEALSSRFLLSFTSLPSPLSQAELIFRLVIHLVVFFFFPTPTFYKTQKTFVISFSDRDRSPWNFFPPETLNPRIF